MVALLTALVLTGTPRAHGQPPGGEYAPPIGWHWQKGQVLVYRFEQNTQAADMINNNKVETSTKLQLTKRWEVLEVDATRTATLQLKLLALKMETTTPGGDVLVYDSTNVANSTEGLRERLSPFIGPVLAVLRVNDRGQVVEVKESKFGPASKYENELPFVGVLPVFLPREGQTWDRQYKVTLDPPQGTGEQFPAVQHNRLKSTTGSTLTIGLTTELKQEPTIAADRVPLLQLMPEGEWVFDTQKGRLISARLKIDRTLDNHRGEGSSHQFRSQTTEQLVEE
jgi:hypothetical protein